MGCCASSYKRKWKHEHTGHEVSHGNYNGGYHVGDYEGNHGEKNGVHHRPGNRH